MKAFLTLAAGTVAVLGALAIGGAGLADSRARTGCTPPLKIQNPGLRTAFADRDRQRNPEWTSLCRSYRAAIAADSRK